MFHSMLGAYAVLVLTLYGDCKTRLYGFRQHYMADWRFYLFRYCPTRTLTSCWVECLWLLICSEILWLAYAKKMNYRCLGNDFFMFNKKISMFYTGFLFVQQMIVIVSKWRFYVQQMIFKFSKWILHSTRNLYIQQFQICVQYHEIYIQQLEICI